jgi:hypothetical protein
MKTIINCNKNKEKLEKPVSYWLYIINHASCGIFSSFRKERCFWVVKQEPVKAGIEKNGFALPCETRRRWQITDRNISLRKIILVRKAIQYFDGKPTNYG